MDENEHDQSAMTETDKGSEERTGEGVARPEVNVGKDRSQKESLGVTLLGVLLIAVGVASLFERVFEVDISVMPLLVGLGLLFLWYRSKNRGLLIGGWVVTGLGTGILLESVFRSFGTFAFRGPPFLLGGGSAWIDALPVLGLAAGFLAIYGFDKSRPLWAVIVAGVLGVLSGGKIIADSIEFFVPEMRAFVFPIILIAIGLLLIVRAVKRPGS